MVPDKVPDMVDSSTSICPNIGDRVECSEHLGTIKYVGEIEGYDGTWLGIDWDDPERGKHNGSVNDVQYFKASHPKSGSFVHPEKVQLGRSAVTAITTRYGSKDDELSAHRQDLLRFQQTINAPFLEMVGFDRVIDKQRNFNDLEVVNLRMQNVKIIGGPLALKNLCPNIRELDISKNLFTSWSLIFEVCSQLENLVWLNVSQNFLQIPDDYDKYSFPNVKYLICGLMNLTWPDVIKLSQVFCNVEEFRAPINAITSLDTPVDNNLKSIKLLDLESNEIKSWNEVCKLSVLPLLECLYLENANLDSIRFEDCGPGGKTKMFKNLRKLVISNNLINDWESIGELNKLESLEDLRFLKNPITETENYATCIQLVVARIANLKIFNAVEIKPEERRGAEYDYIKKYGIEWLSVKGTEKQEDFLRKHPLYLQLLDKYGAPEESELKVESKLIKGSLIEFEIMYKDRTIDKKLPPSILVQKLVMLVQRLFNLSERPTLVYISGSQPDIEINLDDECKELGYYSVQNGDQIIVKN